MQPGEIYRIISHDATVNPALVLLTGVHMAPQTHMVTLLTPDIQFATDTDLLLDTHHGNLPYDLLVETDIFGYIHTCQLIHHLATVPLSITQAVRALRQEDSLPQPAAGPPLLAREDPRWAFKLHELRRLQRFAGALSAVLYTGAA